MKTPLKDCSFCCLISFCVHGLCTLAVCLSMVEKDVGAGKGWVGMRRQEAGLSPAGWGGGSGKTEPEVSGVRSCQEG